MVNKKIGLKAILLVGSIAGLSLSFAPAVFFNIDLGANAGITAINEEAVTKNMMPIHFSDNGNDFGGFLYIQDGETASSSVCRGSVCGEYVSFEGGSGYICQQHIRGFYYNSERGERLWPLDEQTWVNLQGGLTTDGGLYTRCVSEELADALDGCADSEEEDEAQCEADVRDLYGTLYGYYGMVRHTYEGQNYGLIAGAEYRTDASSRVSIDGVFSETFIRYGNKYPVGLLYDYNGGVGFVGCEFTDKVSGLRTFINRLNAGIRLDEMFEEDEDREVISYSGENDILNCEDVGYAANSLINMIVEGLVGLGHGTGSDASLIGNQTNTKMQYFTSTNVDNTALFNYARKKAEILCRGKWKTYDEFIGKGPQSLNCINAEGNTIWAEPGYTYIVKEGHVMVKAMEDFKDDGYYYDIFLEGGNLILDNEDLSGRELKRVFTKDGFIWEEENRRNSVDKYVDLVREGIESGEGYKGDLVAVGAYIKGNFIINGNLEPSNGDRINSRYFIYGKFTTQDSFLDLEKLFSWRCTNGVSSDPDEVYCPLSIRGGDWINPYENAFLVVIDQNYYSPLFS